MVAEATHSCVNGNRRAWVAPHLVRCLVHGVVSCRANGCEAVTGAVGSPGQSKISLSHDLWRPFV
jgi:hypothetical protein